MNATHCPDCLKIYTSTAEIIQAGGRCRNIGASLFCWCVCGAELQNVGRLWIPKRYEQLAEQQTEGGHPQPPETHTGD